MKKNIFSIGLLLLIMLALISGCSGPTSTTTNQDEPVVGNLKYDSSMDIQYAENFSVDYYEGGYALISILTNDTRFLVVPENMQVPEGLDEDISVIQQPVSNIYLVATSAMALFDQLNALDVIRLSGTNADGWYVDNAVKEMEAGNILFAGKYSEPDYELIRSENSTLSIQSGMIDHAPDIRDKLQELGITVFIDQSSYESHPLGRTEWIKVYSVLLDKEELAYKIFNEQAKVLDELSGTENTGKTVSFFYISLSGNVSVRNSHDYVPKMIDMAGGHYIFENLGDPNKAVSTTMMGMEEFYVTAKDSDYIIYNTTITGEIESLGQLLEKSELLSNFKAVKEGNVWCTHQNLLQHPDQLGTMLGELHTILTTKDESLNKLTYFYKLQ